MTTSPNVPKPPKRSGDQGRADAMRLLAEGYQLTAVARLLGVNRRTVRVWRDSPKGQVELDEARKARESRLAEGRDAARAELAPVFAAFGREVVTGHYGALEGLDYMADCDATITLGDPRPNLLAEADKAAYLGLDAEGRLDALAAAELQQAHGRLRTVHRTRPGRQLHVGSVVPGGWAGLAVDVRRMPSGRPRTAAAGMEGADLRRAREAAGMGLRELGRALGVSDGTVRRYESGEREIPEAVVRAVRTLGLGAPETPLQNRVYQGVSGASSVQESPSRGFGRSPLQGVSGAASVNCDAPTAPRRARRIDLAGLTGTDDHGGTR